MSTLDSKLRKQLENVVKEARDIAEAGACEALQALTVHEGKRGGHLNEQQAELRNRLRIHGRQLGDDRRDNGDQAIDRLVNESAYEHWHRMLFSRFLAASDLLVEPQSGMAVSLEDVAELASEENIDPWELAASYATGMLPQIFRVDSPVLAISLPREKRKRLEELLESLPNKVFLASDSLGWVYQFWQANEKDRVNESEVKIGVRELPAVTQLFTEPYMVSFLLDNSLGAWWAARRLTEEDLRTATSEQQLREKASLPGVPLEYLRFVRTSSSHEGPWTPAAGKFEAWPESLSELKTLDPCCGSGHFLVAAFLMLVPMRMELEGFTTDEAVDRVLCENLHGLEIDQRCVELAAFALALAAWRFPGASSYRVLPDLNVACCGLSVSVAKEEWKKLAGENNQLKIALDWMYDEFKDAPILGSLLNPAKSMAAKVVEWEELKPLFCLALSDEQSEQQREAAVVAFGLVRAAIILAGKYDLIVTNVPYLGSLKQDERIVDYVEGNFKDGKADLATAFMLRLFDSLAPNGFLSLVTPQNWLFQKTYAKFRKHILQSAGIGYVVNLGEEAWSSFGLRGPRATLLLLKNESVVSNDSYRFFCITASTVRGETPILIAEKEEILRGNQSSEMQWLLQREQLSNPGNRILATEGANGALLGDVADALHGQAVGDNTRFNRQFWEIACFSDQWEPYQMPPNETSSFNGRDSIVFWENESGEMCRLADSVKHLNHKAQQWRSGKPNWGKHGVAINLVGKISATLYSGEIYSQSCCVIVPKDQADLASIWAYAQSGVLATELRRLDPGVAVSVKTVLSVPFDVEPWFGELQISLKAYSDDPTQWIFHGHPASCTDALQVAVVRLLGYRWPAELNEKMELATDARAWAERSSQLIDLADDDGIVCIPAVASEQPAEERLLSLLHRGFKDGLAQEKLFSEKLDAANESDPVTLDLLRHNWKATLPSDFNIWLNRLLDADDHKGKSLESWLRYKFFDLHCKRFNHRPFVWNIWDGHLEGFSALVNYHNLAGPNGRRLLEKLTHSYLGDWITRQQDEASRGVEGADARLIAARSLKSELERILKGDPPYDIFVRWKPLHKQPIGWEPDINDGVRLNIRPFMAVDILGGKKGAGILRVKPNISWTKDRGKEVKKTIEDFPWFWDWDEKTQDFTGVDKFTSNRWNDLHYTNAFKQRARELNASRDAEAAK